MKESDCMKKTLMMTLVTALMVTMVSFGAFAKSPAPRKLQPNKGNRIFAELKLTEEQQDKIRVIRQQFEKDTIDIRHNLQTKQRELAKLWSTKPLNQAAIDAKTKEVNALRIQMITKQDAMKEKIKAVLTPEQQKAFYEKMKERKNRRPGPGPRPNGQCRCGGMEKDKK